MEISEWLKVFVIHSFHVAADAFRGGGGHNSLSLKAISSVTIAMQYGCKPIIHPVWKEKNNTLGPCDIFMYKFENH